MAARGHECAIAYVTGEGTPAGRCTFPAHRRDAAGKWLCRKHLRAARARAAAAGR